MACPQNGQKMGQRRRDLILKDVLYILLCVSSVNCVKNEAFITNQADTMLKSYIDGVLSDEYQIIPGIKLEKLNKTKVATTQPRTIESIPDYVKRKLEEYTQTHALAVDFPQTARFFICKF